MPTLQVITLGCSKNTVDTEHLLFQVRHAYELVPESESRPVDVLEQSIQTILACVARKKAGEVGRLIVFGCLSQRYSSELPSLIPEVDGWFGARDLAPLVEALGCQYKAGESYRRVLTEGNKPYAYFKISEGCNRRCSYCAIPFIRGAHRSVPMEELVEEAKELAARGIRELIIIAQDTTYYGLDLYGRRALAELLRKLSFVDGIEWLRIHYSYPADFPEDVLEEMARNPKVCKYMDIPLQHFDELLAFVQEARFQRMGAFTYSEEEGTYGAEHYRDSISAKVKQKRLDMLMEAQRGISLAYNQSRIGTEVRVLVDDFVEGTLVCRSEFESPEVDGEILVKYTPEAFDGVEPYSLVGEFLQVRITGADEYDLTAQVI